MEQKTVPLKMYLEPEKEVWLVYLFAFSNLSSVLKDDERSGKHVQHLKVFLFFNLVCCSIHFLVTFPPFLNALFLRYGTPRPPSSPSFRGTGFARTRSTDPLANPVS